MGGCGCNLYKKIKKRVIKINAKTICWHQSTCGTWLADGAHQTSKYSTLTVKHVYRCGTKICIVVASVCRQDMGTGLMSCNPVVALRLFHVNVTDDSYNVVTMKMFYFEIVHWNLWRFYWSKLIKKFANILYFQLYLSKSVDTAIKMVPVCFNVQLYEALEHAAIWGTATYSYMRHCNMQLYEALQHTAIWATTVKNNNYEFRNEEPLFFFKCS